MMAELPGWSRGGGLTLRTWGGVRGRLAGRERGGDRPVNFTRRALSTPLSRARESGVWRRDRLGIAAPVNADSGTEHSNEHAPPPRAYKITALHPPPGAAGTVSATVAASLTCP